MSGTLLPALKPLPIKERLSVIFVERGEIDMLDGAFVVVDTTGVRNDFKTLDFKTLGANRRTPSDFDGIQLVSFLPEANSSAL